MKFIVEYDHDPAAFHTIYLSVSKNAIEPGEWVPAYCDTIDGTRVVWVRFPPDAGPFVWLKDRDVVRNVEYFTS